MRALLAQSVDDDGDGPLRAGFRRPLGPGDQVGVVRLVFTAEYGRVAQVVVGFEELRLGRPAATVPLTPPAVDEYLHPAPPPNHRDMFLHPGSSLHAREPPGG